MDPLWILIGIFTFGLYFLLQRIDKFERRTNARFQKFTTALTQLSEKCDTVDLAKLQKIYSEQRDTVDLVKIQTALTATRKSHVNLKKLLGPRLEQIELHLRRLECMIGMSIREQITSTHQLKVLIDRLNILDKLLGKLSVISDRLSRVEHSQRLYGRASVSVCKQFVMEELTAGILSKIDLTQLLPYDDLPHFSEILQTGEYHLIDIAKTLKGSSTELYVRNFMVNAFPKMETFFTAEQESHPDLEVVTAKEKCFCIEVKEHHDDVDETNMDRFRYYLSFDTYQGGILVNVDQGNIVGYTGQIEFIFIQGKPCILLSGLNYDLSLLYYAVHLLMYLIDG